MDKKNEMYYKCYDLLCKLFFILCSIASTFITDTFFTLYLSDTRNVFGLLYKNSKRDLIKNCL